VTIAVSRRGSIGLLQIDRPAARNALDDQLLHALIGAVEGMRDDSQVRALILTGAGTVFCAGDDLKAALKATRAQFAGTIRRLQTLSVALLDLGKPTVAALNGPAFGGGLELALNCDVRIATADFQCATPEVQLGLTPTNAATFSGARFDARWCLQAGLIDELTTAADLLPRAVAIAEELSSGAPLALAATRRLLNAPLRETLKRALDAEEEACVAAHGAEALAGVRAFFAREPTPWK
jgi:enoyl-CoA hydratase/carnithine racemase